MRTKLEGLLRQMRESPNRTFQMIPPGYAEAIARQRQKEAAARQ